MKLKPEGLTGHLKQSLLPIYCVSGDEPLLIQEAVAAINQTAQSKNFTERHRFTTDSTFDIDTLHQLTQSGSLFGDQKRIEINVPGKLPAELAEFIIALSNRSIDDAVFILSTAKLDAAAQKTNWYKTIDQIGCHITVWPIEAKQLPGWLQARARNMNVQLDANALGVLSQCIEGNLLAAAQWLEKLSLQYPNTRITETMMTELMEDSSRYDVFEWVAQVLQGNGNKAWHILQKLQVDGEATLIVWALAKELRIIYQMQQQLGQHRQRMPLATLFQQFYIWPKRQPEFEAALRRISAARCLQTLQQLAKVDTMIKGGIADDPWMALANVISTLCASP